MQTKYQLTQNATLTVESTRQPDSERLLARARQYEAAGRDATYWFRAAEIIRRIEHGLPVGHHRRRRRGRRAGKAVTA